MKKWTKDWRILLLITAVIVVGIVPLFTIGLDYGMDLKGGSLITIRLEESVGENKMSTMTTILQNRLNSFGLKDISVKGRGNQHILVEVSSKEEQDVDSIKNILSKQGRFEASIDGTTVLESDDLDQIITNPQKGYGYLSSTQQWKVPFKISKDGAQKFAEEAEGRCKKEGGVTECDMIYMFIDRPRNATILLPEKIAEEEETMHVDPASPNSRQISFEELEKNSKTNIVVSDTFNKTLLETSEKVVVPENNNYTIPENASVTEALKTEDYWSWSALGLKSVLSLTPGVTSGETIRQAVITGGAPNFKEAQNEMNSMVVILRSGRLPVSTEIASTNTISATLGENFINSALLMGVLALVVVSLIVFARYRKPKITLAMLGTNLCEVILVLGVASLIHWEIDLPAIAGIIAVLGTGIDQQIIVTDGALRKTEEEAESLLERIKKAFGIVLAAGITTIATMLPLMTMGLGMLKGFAITTALGVTVGVTITRPAFANIVKRLV